MSVETIERVKSAALPIVCLVQDPDGSLSVNGGMGSGFFINSEGYFVTAEHVINALEVRSKNTQDCLAPAIQMPKGGWSATQGKPDLKFFRFDNCLKDAESDIAVCRPLLNPFEEPEVKSQLGFVTFASSSAHSDGTPVAFTAFPLDLTRPVTSKANIASFLMVQNLIMIDKTAWPGASGSPLYLADGTVIGMVVSTGTNEGSGLAYARRVESITAFLSKSRIAFH